MPTRGAKDAEKASTPAVQPRQKRLIRKPKLFDDSRPGSPVPTIDGKPPPTIRGVAYYVGSKVEAQDFMDQWYSARMIEVDFELRKALIHFERWNKRYDEWIPFGSNRVRPEKPQVQISGKRGKGRATTAANRNTSTSEAKSKRSKKDTAAHNRAVKAESVASSSTPTKVKAQLHTQPQSQSLSQPQTQTQTQTQTPNTTTATTATATATDTATDTDTATSPNAHHTVAGGTSPSHVEEPLKLKMKISHKKRQPEQLPTTTTTTTTPTTTTTATADSNDDVTTRKQHKRHKLERGSKLDKTVSGLATEQLNVVQTDFNCSEPDCGKTFRKQSQLTSHRKYYHPESTTPSHATATPKKLLRSTPGSQVFIETQQREAALSHARDQGDLNRDVAPTKATNRDIAQTKATNRSSSKAAAQKAKRKRDAEPMVVVQREKEERTLPIIFPPLAPEDIPIEDSVTRCICGFEDESDYMIQCERCQCWQHGDCVGVSEDACPDKYTCFNCQKTTSKTNKSVAKAAWVSMATKGQNTMKNLRVLPASVDDVDWDEISQEASDRRSTPKLSKLCPNKLERERHQLVTEVQEAMQTDFIALEQSLRSVRLLLSQPTYHPSISAKTRMEVLEKRQEAIQALCLSTIADQETLASITTNFITVNNETKADKNPTTLEQSSLMLKQLHKKYDERILGKPCV